MRIKELTASFTIEMAVILPLVMSIFMGIILTVFYYHDKNILNGAAYETVVIGSSKIREKEEVTKEELIEICRERIKGKCIYLTKTDIGISITENEIEVELIAAKNNYKVTVVKRAALTEPEKKIRDVRRLNI